MSSTAAAPSHTTRARPILSGPIDSRGFPDWLATQRREAWKQFQTLPGPTRKDQLWRFSNVDLLDLSPFKFSEEENKKKRAAILDQSCGLERVAARLVFAGDELLEHE